MSTIAAGHPAPDFSLKALDGQKYSLHALLRRGPVVLGFFKVSCPVCQFTFPFLERLFQQHSGGAVTILGISQDELRASKEFAREYGITFPVLLDEHNYAVSNAYGLTNVPTVFLVASDGGITVSSIGFNREDLEGIARSLAESGRRPAVTLFRPDEAIPAYKPG